jgi:5-methylcytosine-specific restriction endonuclease McrA
MSRFYRRGRSFQGYCKSCSKEYLRSYRSTHPQFREQERQREARKYVIHRQAQLARARLKYYAQREKILSNIERRRDAARKFRMRHPDHVNRWRLKHPHLSRAGGHRYRARKAAAPGSHSVGEWLAKVEYYGWKCRYCGKPLSASTLTLDHAVPLSRGGSNWPSNLLPACGSCNSIKNTKTFMEFMRVLATKDLQR